MEEVIHIAMSKIASLYGEVINNTVELGAAISESMFASAQSFEIL
jgi:hypothetical protein